MRSDDQFLGLSPGEYFELMLRVEDFKGYLDKLSMDIIEGLQAPRPAFGPPPLMKSKGRGQKSAWPQRNPFGVGSPAIGIVLDRASNG
jgi:hypothetical protein